MSSPEQNAPTREQWADPYWHELSAYNFYRIATQTSDAPTREHRLEMLAQAQVHASMAAALYTARGLTRH